VYSQTDSTFRDSIEEIIIYEYDTVYVEADTIRLTDTIFEIVKAKPKKKKKFVFPKLPSVNPRLYQFSIIPVSVGLSASSFVGGNFKEHEISDSISTQPVFNAAYLLHLNYNLINYNFSLNVGFSPFHEKYNFKNTYFSPSPTTSPPANYDSLQIYKEYVANYYYNYLNIYTLIGRDIPLNDKLIISVKGGFSADFLLEYKQGNTPVRNSDVRNFDFSLVLFPQLIYRIKRNFEFHLSPFYQFSLINDNKYPNTTFRKLGLDLGFNIILHKRNKI
ncbi:MAG: hypothetical protein P1P88_19050, partial [Bacteroidales bacterium]|nr:hypothetical protein [Bacteroidales bacterium]